MKLYIAMEIAPQRWRDDDIIYECHGSTMAYYDRERLESILINDLKKKYKIIEIEMPE